MAYYVFYETKRPLNYSPAEYRTKSKKIRKYSQNHCFLHTAIDTSMTAETVYNTY